MHIGNQIHKVVKEKGIRVNWLADQICCTRPHLYKIFRTASIDTGMLARISKALNHDFFEDLSCEWQEESQSPENQDVADGGGNYEPLPDAYLGDE
ncbi:MAG: helix-turn-helix domain-containing protein [Bacteroidales bacterium]|nr:helix-turn-helix domain-containing protein [Bacteroidales bacterium]